MGGRHSKARPGHEAARCLDPEVIPSEGIAALARVVAVGDDLTVRLIFRWKAGLMWCDAALAGRRKPAPDLVAALRERALERLLIADLRRRRDGAPAVFLYLATDAEALETAECLNTWGRCAAVPAEC